MKWRRSAKALPWHATHTHDLVVRLTRRRFPPFYSTALFLPRFKLEVINEGGRLEQATIQIDVAPWDLPPAEIDTGDYPVDWQHAMSFPPVATWKAGDKKQFDVRLEPRVFRTEGTYVLKVRVQRVETRMSSVTDMWQATLKEAAVPQEKWEEIMLAMRIDSDPDRPRLMGFADEVYRGHMLDYIRVEPFSNVLNFGVVAVTFTLGVATVLLAVFD